MLSLLVATSLSVAEPPPPPIVYGDLEAGFPEAIAIGAAFGDNSISVCSGTLITPRIILTAAHCGSDLPIELVTSVGIAFFGADIADPDEMLRFEDYAVHPAYVPLQNGVTNGENDVSILVLEEEASAEPAWVRLEPLSEDEAIDQEVVSVGFGATEDGAGDGRKRSAVLTIDSMDEMFLVSRSRTNDNEANICSGDSGGPQFFVDEQGRNVVWGVHSWGDSGCNLSSGSTRTDVTADWLMEQIAAVHGTDDLCEAAGRYEDGVCDEDRCPDDPDCALPDDTETQTAGCATRPHPPGSMAAGWVMLGVIVGMRRQRRRSEQAPGQGT